MKLKNILFLAILAITVTSCETVIELDLPETGALIVVESQITDIDERFEVLITKSQPFNNQNLYTGIENAVVVITSTNGSIDTLIHEQNGLYATPYPSKCMVGESYTLTFTIDGEVYTATEKCKPQIEIDTFMAFFLPDQNGFIEPGFYAFLGSGEWEEPGDFYEWKVYRNDTLIDDFGYILDTDEFRESSYFNMNVDPEDPLANFPQVQPRPFPYTFEADDSVRVEQYNISEVYYEFLIEVTNQLNRQGTPFDPAPANPKSNITNGALGYFSVASKQEVDLLVVE
jgi:hypothetical protein